MRIQTNCSFKKYLNGTKKDRWDWIWYKPKTQWSNKSDGLITLNTGGELLITSNKWKWVEKQIVCSSSKTK